MATTCPATWLQMPLGSLVVRATVEPYDSRESLLTVYAEAHPAMILMDHGDAHTIARQIGVAVASMPAEVAPPENAPDVRGRARRPRPEMIASPRSGGRSPRATGRGPRRCSRRPGHPQSGSCSCSTSMATNWSGPSTPGSTARPNDADPYLARGANAVLGAFQAHGEATGRAANETFWAELRNAERDLSWSVELGFDDPVPWTPLLRSARGLWIPKEELCMRYDESARRNPELLGAHLETLEALSPIGVGSIDELFAFARTISGPLRRARRCTRSWRWLIWSTRWDSTTRTHDAATSRATLPARSSSSHACRSKNEAWKERARGGRAARRLRGPPTAEVRRACPAHTLLERVGVSRSVRPWAMLADGDALFHEVVTTPA